MRFQTLLVINRTSGTGLSVDTKTKLQAVLSAHLMPASWRLHEVLDHPSVLTTTEDFLSSINTPALVIAGGGGGTLRAVVEAVCRKSERRQIRIAALRMGSGNVLAKLFGVPRDPATALSGILKNQNCDRTVKCSVVQCSADSGPVYFAATMGGFGEFGRIPGDLARWHRRISGLRKALGTLIGLEKLTDMEYALAMFLRCAHALFFPWTVDRIAIRTPDRNFTMRLLAGVLLKFPFKAVPVDPGIEVQDEAAKFYFVPQSLSAPLQVIFAPRRTLRKAFQYKMQIGSFLEIMNLRSRPLDFFLDEDPQQFQTILRFEMAGALEFVPGPDYVYD